MSIPSWVKPGSKIVCVNAAENQFLVPGFKYRAGLHGLRLHAIYTVRDSYTDPEDGISCVRLKEIERPLDRRIGVESGYAIARFRPLVTRSIEDDLAIFRPILDQVREAA